MSLILGFIFLNPNSYQTIFSSKENSSEKTGENEQSGGNNQNISESAGTVLAKDLLKKIEIKGRAPKTGYSRKQFYDNWPEIQGCSLRQRIIKRDFGETAKTDSKCNVIAGTYYEPYNGEFVSFSSKKEISKKVQIDHVVAISDAWQKGAIYMTKEQRYKIATDELNLLAVDGPANQQKSDGDAATWLPKNKAFRCQYVARQTSVKYRYGLWMTQAEHDAISKVLEACPEEKAIL